MNTLTFNKLYIFSTFENKAKYIEFTNGKNIITTEDDIIGNKKVSQQFLKIYIILWEQTAILKINGMSKRRYPF